MRFRVNLEAVKVSMRATGEYPMIFEDGRARDAAIAKGRSTWGHLLPALSLVTLPESHPG